MSENWWRSSFGFVAVVGEYAFAAKGRASFDALGLPRQGLFERVKKQCDVKAKTMVRSMRNCPRMMGAGARQFFFFLIILEMF